MRNHNITKKIAMLTAAFMLMLGAAACGNNVGGTDSIPPVAEQPADDGAATGGQAGEQSGEVGDGTVTVKAGSGETMTIGNIYTREDLIGKQVPIGTRGLIDFENGYDLSYSDSIENPSGTGNDGILQESEVGTLREKD